MPQGWDARMASLFLYRPSGERGAAEILGLKPTTLESRMKRLGIRCCTEGETEAEARTLIEDIEDAIRLHVQDRMATGEPIYHEVGAIKVRVAL